MDDDDDVQSLVSEIIHTLQDDCGYLKPQPKSTAGNVQGDGIFNWDAHMEVENICKKFSIKKKDDKAIQQMIDDNTIGIGELD